MDKIIFTLNNSDIHHDYASLAMVVFELLLEKHHSSVAFYIKKLGCFDEKDFHNLNKRIVLEPQLQVPMNEKHFLMFYAVVRYGCRAFDDKDEKSILFQYAREIPDEFNGIRDKVHSFGEVITEKFKREYKQLKSFQILLKKIEDYE